MIIKAVWMVIFGKRLVGLVNLVIPNVKLVIVQINVNHALRLGFIKLFFLEQHAINNVQTILLKIIGITNVIAQWKMDFI